MNISYRFIGGGCGVAHQFAACLATTCTDISKYIDVDAEKIRILDIGSNLIPGGSYLIDKSRKRPV